MTRELLFVHGRSQEDKDSFALKAEWIESFEVGLQKSGLSLPIAETSIRFPYYGDTLAQMIQGKTPSEAAAIVVRGNTMSPQEEAFARSVLEEICNKAGITPQQLESVSSAQIVTRGPQHWEWVQAVLKAIDRYVPYGSSSAIALFTADVYQYLQDSTIRTHIENGIAQAMKPGVETVVVAHSLGTVVAYNLLRREGHLRGWKVPLFVTLGSPLAVGEIRATLKSFAPLRRPECAGDWLNAMDDRDVVALYPLDAKNFPIHPPTPVIRNKTDVRNRTSNCHGIAGYLDDAEVAKWIHGALS